MPMAREGGAQQAAPLQTLAGLGGVRIEERSLVPLTRPGAKKRPSVGMTTKTDRAEKVPA